MDRLQKKCLLVSVGFHLSLMSLLVVGPAFLAPKAKPPLQVPPIDFIPFQIVESTMSGGGNPNADSAPPPPAIQAPPAPTPAPPEPKPVVRPTPPPPTPKVKPPPEPEPDPEPTPKLQPRNNEPDPNNLELKQEKKKQPHKIVASATVVKHDTDKESKEKERLQKQKERERARARAEAEARAEQERAEESARAAIAAWRRGVASEFAQSSKLIGNGLNKSGTSVELRGGGGGGLPYAGFLQAIQAAYDRAWTVPPSVSDEAVAFASVTIAHDGSVVSYRFTRRSGNREADRSVQAALERVKSIGAALPDSVQESQCTVEVKFSVKAKRMMG